MALIWWALLFSVILVALFFSDLSLLTLIFSTLTLLALICSAWLFYGTDFQYIGFTGTDIYPKPLNPLDAAHYRAGPPYTPSKLLSSAALRGVQLVTLSSRFNGSVVLSACSNHLFSSNAVNEFVSSVGPRGQRFWVFVHFDYHLANPKTCSDVI